MSNPLRPAKTEQEKWAARALAILAKLDPDMAREQNGVGFNSTDGGIGHSLAAMLAKRGGLTEKQWAAATKICKKYHKQVGFCPDKSQMQVLSETVGKPIEEDFLAPNPKKPNLLYASDPSIYKSSPSTWPKRPTNAPFIDTENREARETLAGELSSREQEQPGRPVAAPTSPADGKLRPNADGSLMTAEEWRDFDVRR